MRQEYIEAFLEIVKTRNINRAAENLHLSQSTVSQYLKQLEEELDLQLIIRYKGYRGVELTRYGEDFISLAQNWLGLVHKMETMHRNPKLELTIGAVDSLNASVLYPVCKKLLSDNVDMNIHIRTAQSSDLYEMAKNGEIDIGFVGFEMANPNVISTYAFSQRVCIVRKRSEDDQFLITSPDKLPEEHEISLNWSPEYHKWRNKYWDSHIRPHISTDAMLLLRCFMNTAGCWAVIPEIDLADMKNDDFEVCNLGDANPPDRKIFKITSRYSSLGHAPTLQLFQSALNDFIDENPFLYR